MAVLSSGEYGIDEGLVFSYPVVCKNGEYKIIQGVKWSPEVKKRVETTLNELREQRDMALKAVS